MPVPDVWIQYPGRLEFLDDRPAAMAFAEASSSALAKSASLSLSYQEFETG